MLLNFGHTLGHAYEKAGHYEKWTHGQAVAAGMVKAAGLGEQLGITPAGTADQIVIACGGGGIPVMEQGWNLRGASAIIEKDLASGLLAKEVDADVLLILTDVPNVYVNYGKEDQKALETLSVQEAEELMAEGQFEAATMLPKIEAALDFVTHGNHRKAVITSLEKAQDSMAKKAGTVIQ